MKDKTADADQLQIPDSLIPVSRILSSCPSALLNFKSQENGTSSKMLSLQDTSYTFFKVKNSVISLISQLRYVKHHFWQVENKCNRMVKIILVNGDMRLN